MNVKEIRIQAQLHNSMKIDLQFALKYINEAMNTLAATFDTARVHDFITITAEKDKIHNLPAELLTIKECTKNDRHYGDYKVYDDKIKFADSGDYDLTILKMPKPVTVSTQVPEINPLYHYALALFVASREKSRIFGDEDLDSQRLMMEFHNAANDANLALSTKKKTKRVMQAPIWR